MTTTKRDSPTSVRRPADDFAAVFDRHRRELHVHCYRMTGSFTDAEDLTQETFLRAWRGRDRFEERASMRTWLYRIATNACLDFLKRHERRTAPTEPLSETLERNAWIDPYPDRLLGGPSSGADPAEAVTSNETTTLLLEAALVHLPPRQRAALIARDLVGLSAAETATLLECSVASVNSLAQRARTTIRRHAPGPDSLRGQPTHDDDLLGRYIDAHHRGDVSTILAMLGADIRVTMPPEPPCIGPDGAEMFFGQILGASRPGDWQLVATRANGCPAAANYLRRPGDDAFRAVSVDVLDIRDGRLVAIHCFLGDRLFPAFGLPQVR